MQTTQRTSKALRAGRTAARARRDVLDLEVAKSLSGATVIECLMRRTDEPEATALSVESIDEPRVTFTVRELFAQVSRAAHGLARLGVGPRDRVMIVLPTSADFVFSFWGTLLGGATPVPAYPPVGLHQLPIFQEKLARMATVVNARLVIMPEALRAVLTTDGDGRIGGAQLITPEEMWECASTGVVQDPVLPSADDLALIQFSSGSTGDPRAICLTHGNILTNVRAFLARIQMQAGDVCVSWLPLYHDMGLIGAMMGTLLARMQLVLMPPTDFLRRPARWLELMGQYGATVSVAPQFAYNLCVRKADPLPDADLSSLRLILNGAEPIDPRGVTAFQRRFRALGLRPNVVIPCYGLAEGTLAASMRFPGQRLRTIALPAAADGNGGSSKVVCVGRPMQDAEIQIRSPRGAWLGPGKIGEICLRGPAVTAGYLGVDGMTTACDRDGWLATGDLGFLDEGELFVTGRLKDLIIIGGRNLYPQDIEATAAEVDGLRPGRVAAFGITEPERATEVLVLLAEVNEATTTGAGAASALRQRLRARFAVTPYDIVLLRRGQIPLTTSGKIRRAQARTEYQRGSFTDPVYHARLLGG